MVMVIAPGKAKPDRLSATFPRPLGRPSTSVQPHRRSDPRPDALVHGFGRREWHTHSGYSKRSLVENTMYRYKTIIGRSMRSRTFDGQQAEVQLACGILNTMTRLGMPDSYRVA
jgi:hypothetical protein